MEKAKPPWGIAILGGINFFILGVLFLIIFSLIYLNLSPQNWETFKEVIADKGINLEWSLSQFKTAILVQLIISLVFALSGLGLLLKKEWARRFTLYFSFLLTLLIAFSVFSQPSLIRQAFPQIIYLGILIIYFTNKNVESYFKTTDEHKPQIE